MPLEFCLNENDLECGLDEAGAGPLAGPVFAAAVVWANDYSYFLDFSDFEDTWEYEWALLSEKGDSKKMTERQRNAVAEFVKHFAIDYSIAYVSNEEIDRINILNARFKAMHKAVNQLTIIPNSLLVDGDRFNRYVSPQTLKPIKHTCIPEGDAKYLSIAAASVLAKVERDKVMQQLHDEYPVYNWGSNKGYGTAEHYRAIAEHGSCKFHRKSFRLT